MIKLDYFDLISDEPITVENVGSIICPKLSDIKKLNYYTYCSYIQIFKITPDDYFEELENKFNIKIPIEEFAGMTKFDLLMTDTSLLQSVVDAFNFFFTDEVYFDGDQLHFVVYTTNENGEENVVGYISRDNYSDIVNIILQRINIEIDDNEVDDLSKIKSKRGRKILEKIREGRKKMKKAKEKSSNGKQQSLANIISSVAAYSKNTNYIQIWDLTIYQLYDLFSRLNIIDQYNIASRSVSVWGDEKKQFKYGVWNDNIHERN
jgi:hypothetical protein|nr:MAG TPA: hypothetical protein [Caudoviricetes sp.]